LDNNKAAVGCLETGERGDLPEISAIAQLQVTIQFEARE